MELKHFIHETKLVFSCCFLTHHDDVETTACLTEVEEAVARLKARKAPTVRNITKELLKAEGETISHGLHAALIAFWCHSSSLEKRYGCPCLERDRAPTEL